MITWKHLVECIEKLETLPNGGGSEIEFTYNGEEFGIVSYPGCPDITRLPGTWNDETSADPKYQTHQFKSLRELGKANIYGFVIEEIWDSLDEYDYEVRPDFARDDFDIIFAAYKKACAEHGW